MSQYRSILKATSLFGGTQVISILITIIRSKFVAILIGSTGMGLSAMYMSSLTMIITIFGLGIGTSVVRELSSAHSENDIKKFALIATIYRRILLFMAIAGTLFVMIISPFLSEWAFQNKEHTIAYCFLSLIVFFTLLSSGNQALLVSTRRIKDMAASGVIGSIVTLLTSIPLFYFFRVDGIVPGLVISTMSNYLITCFYARKVKYESVKITYHDLYDKGCPMVTLGIAMITASLMGQAVTYLINISISRLGGLSDIGFFNSAMGITMQVVGMVFGAMAADYYPRLAAVMNNKEKMNETINQQSEILLLITVPILTAFMILAPVVIHILLSEEFLVITTFIRIICVGMLLKTASYALGYVSFAKGDKRIFMFLEGGYSNIANLILSVSFYYFWGLTGLAFSFVVNYILYYFIISVVDKVKYGYEVSRNVVFITLLSFVSLGAMLFLDYTTEGVVYYYSSAAIAIVVSCYFMYLLNKKTEIIQSLKFRFLKNEL